MPTKTARKEIPLFEKFSIPQLVELTGYSEGYLEDLKIRRSRPIPYGFRRRVSRMLGMPESWLFDDSEPA